MVKSLRGLGDLGDVAGKTVLLRGDLNVPLCDGAIADVGRVTAALDTLSWLLGRRANVLVLSHLGRPGGESVAKFSLAPVVAELSRVLDMPVRLFEHTVTRAGLDAYFAGGARVAVLENLRFDARETAKTGVERLSFARQLAELGDFFVLDGFGVAHREQASVYELAGLLPHAAGLLVERECGVLEKLTAGPERPYTVVLGGSKVSDKLGVIDALLERVDVLAVGGGMAFTFLAALGHEVGASLLEVEQLERVRGYIGRAGSLGVKLLLPEDIVMADSFATDARTQVCGVRELTGSSLGDTAMGLDIGPVTAESYAREILASKTVFWNGPMGVFEMPAFAAGTRRVAQALADTAGFTVVGGGDSAAAVRALGFADDRFNHISTGGGASLELLEGRVLPGLEVLS